MKINLFTFIAQIINFLILVFILYKMLFKKIIALMDEREKKIQGEIDRAKKLEEDAKKEKESFSRKTQEIENQKSSLLEKMHEEVSNRRKSEIEKVKKEVAALDKKWRDDILSKKVEFFSSLQKETASLACTISKELLQGFANTSLESAALQNFQKRLEKLPEDKKREIKEGYIGKKITFKTSFPISSNDQESLKKSLEKVIDTTVSADFIQDPSLILGVEAKIGDMQIGYSILDYLQNLQEKLSISLTKMQKL